MGQVAINTSDIPQRPIKEQKNSKEKYFLDIFIRLQRKVIPQSHETKLLRSFIVKLYFFNQSVAAIDSTWFCTTLANYEGTSKMPMNNSKALRVKRVVGFVFGALPEKLLIDSISPLLLDVYLIIDSVNLIRQDVVHLEYHSSVDEDSFSQFKSFNEF